MQGEGAQLSGQISQSVDEGCSDRHPDGGIAVGVTGVCSSRAAGHVRVVVRGSFLQSGFGEVPSYDGKSIMVCRLVFIDYGVQLLQCCMNICLGWDVDHGREEGSKVPWEVEGRQFSTRCSRC